jgi:hypothetical protein
LQVCASGRERELESKASLVIQNGILLINALGVWRWLPKAEKDVTGSDFSRKIRRAAELLC